MRRISRKGILGILFTIVVLAALLIPGLPAAAGAGYSSVTVWYGANSVTIDQTTWDALKASYSQTVSGTYPTGHTYTYTGVPVYRLLEQLAGVSALSDYSALVEDGGATPYQVLVGSYTGDHVAVKGNDTLIVADNGTVDGNPDITNLPRLVCPTFTAGKYMNKSIVKITLVYTISVTAPTNGAISPSGYTWNTASTNPWNSTTYSGAVYVTYGGSRTFNIAANTGYYTSTVIVDSAPVAPPPASYPFTNVISKHTLAATFAVNPVVNVSISPASQVVANGATFSVSINISTDTAIRAWQGNVNFDPTKLQIHAITIPVYDPINFTYTGDFLSNWAIPKGDTVQAGGAMNTIANANASGHLTNIAFAVTGTANLSGPTGTGTLFTISFTAGASVDNIASIGLSSILVFDVNGNHLPGVATSDGTVAIGNIPLPDLVVSAASTAADPGDSSNYTITYTIANNGTAAAGASTTSIVIDGGAPITISCPALAVGASDTKTTPVQTLVGTADSVLVTADSDLDVIESNEGNNTRTTSYSYAPSQPGDVPVTGTTQAILTFIIPDPVSWDPLDIGENSANRTMKVTSNGNWQVTILGTNDGFMTKYDGTTYFDTVKLHDALYIMSENNVTLTGALQTLADGTPADQPLDGSGDTRNVIFKQQVYYTDPALTSGFYYKVVVTFTASPTI